MMYCDLESLASKLGRGPIEGWAPPQHPQSAWVKMQGFLARDGGRRGIDGWCGWALMAWKPPPG